MRIGIYPGSFDPVTLGHLDIIKRSSKLVDKLILGVLNNSSKNCLFTAEERVEILQEVTKDIENVEVESFDGLLVDYVDLKHADIIVRGLRAISDFEYELQWAQLNHKINANVETIFLTAAVKHSYLSSSAVKEIAKYGGDIRCLIPETVVDLVYDKLQVNPKFR